MIVLLIAVLLPFLAQANQIDDRNVYEVRKVDGSASYYAERTDKNENTGFYRLRPILLDANGEITVGNVEQVMRDDVELNPSTLKIVRERLQAEFERRFRTVGGMRVPTEEFELAERAKEKALELEQALKPDEPIAEPETANTAATPAQTPNPLVVWGPQVGLVLAAAVLIGIIVKLGVLSS